MQIFKEQESTSRAEMLSHLQDAFDRAKAQISALEDYPMGMEALGLQLYLLRIESRLKVRQDEG